MSSTGRAWYTARVQAVVLAGGLATRMRPRTLTVAKSMLEVAGRPFVDWQLDRLAACGFRDVVMCIGHLGESIRAHVGDGARFGLRVAWSDEGTTLLGTAGAVRNALALLAPTFLVTYGDSWLPFDYSEPLRILDASVDCDGVMAVFENRDRWDASNVAIDGPTGQWVVRYEKATRDAALTHIDYGATALRRETIVALAPGQAHGMDLIQRDLAARKRLRTCIARERFFEIGSPEGLDELDRRLRGGSSRPVSFAKTYLDESAELIRRLDAGAIESVAAGLARVRETGGRLFILGVGGSAGHASHAVNDFRKLCGFEAYAPTDNVSELTARVNDEGWDTSFVEWLRVSRLRAGDGVLVFSVGGGNREKNVSVNLVRSLELARQVGASVFGVVGRDGGYTKQVADACVVIPTVASARVTPHTEGFCAVVWHLLVSHPKLQRAPTKWESVASPAGPPGALPGDR